jgi:hypothetical protein
MIYSSVNRFFTTNRLAGVRLLSLPLVNTRGGVESDSAPKQKTSFEEIKKPRHTTRLRASQVTAPDRDANRWAIPPLR